MADVTSQVASPIGALSFVSLPFLPSLPFALPFRGEQVKTDAEPLDDRHVEYMQAVVIAIGADLVDVRLAAFGGGGFPLSVCLSLSACSVSPSVCLLCPCRQSVCGCLCML